VQAQGSGQAGDAGSDDDGAHEGVLP
jgi:hypothetical protein